MTATEIVKVPFHGSEIHSAQIEGQTIVVLKPSIEAMRVGYQSQFNKLKTRSWAVVSLRAMAGADGKTYQMATIDLDGWAMFLANINENKVKPELKQLVIAYQRESAKALRDYWVENAAINPRITEVQARAVNTVVDEIVVARRKEQVEYKRIIAALAANGAVDKDYAYVQDALYLGLFGASAKTIRASRPQLQGDRYKRGIREGMLIPSVVAKNYLTERELVKLNQAVLLMTSLAELRFGGSMTVDQIKMLAMKVGELAGEGRALAA